VPGRTETAVGRSAAAPPPAHCARPAPRRAAAAAAAIVESIFDVAYALKPLSPCPEGAEGGWHPSVPCREQSGCCAQSRGGGEAGSGGGGYRGEPHGRAVRDGVEAGDAAARCALGKRRGSGEAVQARRDPHHPRLHAPPPFVRKAPFVRGARSVRGVRGGRLRARAPGGRGEGWEEVERQEEGPDEVDLEVSS
jgi:hypothetical protein